MTTRFDRIDIEEDKVLFALFNEKFLVLEEIKLKTHSELRETLYPAFERSKTLAGHASKKTSPWSPRGSAAPLGQLRHRVVEKCPMFLFSWGILKERMQKWTATDIHIVNTYRRSVRRASLRRAVGAGHAIGSLSGPGSAERSSWMDHLHMALRGWGDIGTILSSLGRGLRLPPASVWMISPAGSRWRGKRDAIGQKLGPPSASPGGYGRRADPQQTVGVVDTKKGTGLDTSVDRRLV